MAAVAPPPAKPCSSPINIAPPPKKKQRNRRKDRRRGPRHTPPKWSPKSSSDDSSPKNKGKKKREACTFCTSPTSTKAKLSCDACARTYCDDDGCYDKAYHCHSCGTSACVACCETYEAEVLSYLWKGEERAVKFCSEQCAHKALLKCQRADNPVVRVEA